jgi:hypothetical protein
VAAAAKRSRPSSRLALTPTITLTPAPTPTLLYHLTLPTTCNHPGHAGWAELHQARGRRQRHGLRVWHHTQRGVDPRHGGRVRGAQARVRRITRSRGG